MAEGAPPKRRVGGFTSAILLVTAWVVAGLASARPHWADGSRSDLLSRLGREIEDAIVRIFSGFPGLQELVYRAYTTLSGFLGASYVLTLAVGTLALPLAFVGRMIARARVRAGHADPLDRARSWMARPGRAAAVMAAFPAVSQAFILHLAWRDGWGPGYYVIAALVAGAGQLLVARRGLRDFLAPTLGERETEGTDAIDADEIRFAAVAVTRETRAAVAALAAVSVGVVAWLTSLPTIAFFRDPRVFGVIGAYVAVAAASALLFRGASKISVGVDGIYVGGTSRARFFAYRDLDEARLQGGDIELVRRGRVVLRLQLHGEDAARRDAIMARIHESLARVNDVARDAAANFVTSRTTDKVAQSARGGGDYRMPSVSHDALWSLVEGAAVDAPTRTAAAEAVVRTGVEADRARLRVAAAHCADPRIRVALETLADAADDPAEAAAPRRAMAP